MFFRVSFCFLGIGLVCGGCSNADIGTVVGGAGGALVGAQFGSGTGKLVAVAAGTGLGMWLGNRIGAKLDEYDKKLLEEAQQKALENAPVGQAVPWQNPDNGHKGSVTPLRTYTRNSRPHRTVRMEVFVDGKKEVMEVEAWRDARGIWHPVQS